MNYIAGSDRGEALLLPEVLDDYIRLENPVRFIMRRRKAIIEHCLGTIKRSLGYDYFLCRGLRNVATEINLTVLAYNLKRVCNLVGVKNLIAAVS
jgi:hypothetical protein